MTDKSKLPEEMDETLKAFATSVSAHLRRDVYASDGFDSRTMAAIRREGYDLRTEDYAGGGIGRLLQPRTVRITPLTTALLAVALLVAVAAGSATLARNGSGTGAVVAPQSVLVASAETVHVVRFQLAAPGAHSVALVGDFNDWTRDAITLRPAGKPGVWTASVSLKPGRHEYAFIVDGKRWVADPYADTRRDEYDVESSVLRVGEPDT